VYKLVDVITVDTISKGRDGFGDISIYGRIKFTLISVK
jgi:hypothetical protein